MLIANTAFWFVSKNCAHHVQIYSDSSADRQLRKTLVVLSRVKKDANKSRVAILATASFFLVI